MHKLLKIVSSRLSINKDIYDRSINLLNSYNLPHTAEHVSSVAAKAVELAERYGVDPQKARIAGVLHDISVVIPNEERVEVARSLNIDLFDEEVDFPMIIHQKLSKEFAKIYFGIDVEEILNAISCHTTLHSNPSKLDMIIFLADKISWDQEGIPPYLDRIEKGFDTSLEVAAFNFVDYLMENKESLRVVHPWLVDAHRSLSGSQ